jgi:hypothetical protein
MIIACSVSPSLIYDIRPCFFAFKLDLHQVGASSSAATSAIITEERMEPVPTVLHFSHHHPLLLLEKVPAHRFICRVCGTFCSDLMTYGCLECRCYLHQSCFERKLPQEILHFFHPCPLTLHTVPANSSYNCRACGQYRSKEAFSYACSRCHFVMDVDCTLLPQSKSEGQILHFLHGHPLSLISNINADDHKVVSCTVCGNRCTDPTYACGRRDCCETFYIHKSCLEWPQEIFHPFHPNHPLTLSRWQHGAGDRQCNACRTDIWNGCCSYICECRNCRFCLHIECSVIMAAIKYEGHDHLLQWIQFKNNTGGGLYDIVLECSVCNKSTCGSYGFSCLSCEFNLHHTCGPLPSTIKHKSHIHPLILTNSPAQHEDETDDEFYCDACEEERPDPLLPIYQCIECHFAADIKCLISEVI